MDRAMSYANKRNARENPRGSVGEYSPPYLQAPIRACVRAYGSQVENTHQYSPHSPGGQHSASVGDSTHHHRDQWDFSIELKNRAALADFEDEQRRLSGQHEQQPF